MVRIGSEIEHVDLTLTGATRGHLVATLTAAHLRATRVVGPHYADDGYGDLVEYFAQLASSWRGWVGDRTWTSLEDELSFTARHTGSHVLLTAVLENDPFNGTAPWSARLELTLDAGEQLSSVAAGVADEIGRSVMPPSTSAPADERMQRSRYRRQDLPDGRNAGTQPA